MGEYKIQKASIAEVMRACRKAGIWNKDRDAIPEFGATKAANMLSDYARFAAQMVDENQDLRKAYEARLPFIPQGYSKPDEELFDALRAEGYVFVWEGCHKFYAEKPDEVIEGYRELGTFEEFKEAWNHAKKHCGLQFLDFIDHGVFTGIIPQEW